MNPLIPEDKFCAVSTGEYSSQGSLGRILNQGEEEEEEGEVVVVVVVGVVVARAEVVVDDNEERVVVDAETEVLVVETF